MNLLMYLSIPFLMLAGGVQSGSILGSSRSFYLADPFIILFFIIFAIKELGKPKPHFDQASYYFFAMIAILILSALFHRTYVKSEFLFPFKNFVLFAMIYLMGFWIITTIKKFKLFCLVIVLSGVFMCIQLRSGFKTIALDEIALNRGIAVSGTMTWNSLVGTLSLIFPIALLMLYSSFRSKQKKLSLCYATFISIFLFAIILSGGRQALATMVFTFLLFVLMIEDQKINASRIFLIVLFFAGLWVSYELVSKYFSQFASFADEKRGRFIEDLWNQRILDGLWRPLIEFNFIEGLIFGDAWSNKHNIITTVLYRFGIIGSLLFWMRFVALNSELKKRVRATKSYFLKNIHFSPQKIFLIVFINFFATNFVANIWHQVGNYGYTFWLILGALSGVTYNINRLHFKERKRLALNSTQEQHG